MKILIGRLLSFTLLFLVRDSIKMLVERDVPPARGYFYGQGRETMPGLS